MWGSGGYDSAYTHCTSTVCKLDIVLVRAAVCGGILLYVGYRRYHVLTCIAIENLNIDAYIHDDKIDWIRTNTITINKIL